MKVDLTRQVGYVDVNPSFRMNLGVFFRLLQEAALVHSERVGVGPTSLMEGGTVWVLNRIVAEVNRYPAYQENVRVITWYKGNTRFIAYRDFLVFSGNEHIAAASSMWVLVDLEKKRLRRIPPELGAAYTTEDDSAGEMDIDGWVPERNRIADFTVDITTRYCDLDPVGHLNNTIYFDFVETLAARAFDGNTDIRSLKMQFQKEITLDHRWVSAGIRKTNTGGRFSIFSGETVFASGEITY